MPRFPRKLWEDMTTADFAALDRDRVIAVLPVAAIEQHGPHLPVSVDAAIVGGVVDACHCVAPDDLPVTFLPMMPVGKSNEHMAFPGTLTLSAETLIRLWTEIGESVARSGIRKLVLLNSHGGQPQIMDIVARDLRVRFKMFVVALSYWAVGMPEGLFPAAEAEHGIHGGSSETSLMLHLRPELVRRKSGAISSPPRSRWPSATNICGPKVAVSASAGRPRICTPLAPAAMRSTPTPARPQDRRAVASRIVELLREIDAYPLSALRDV